MINKLMAKVFGTSNERVVKRMLPRVERINALEPEIRKLSDAELAAKTDEFRARIQAKLAEIDAQNANGDSTGEDADARARSKEIEAARDRALAEILDETLEEAFAVVREAGRRVLDMRHFDVQLIGGMVLHQGKIAEMKTGEGKTLVATLPVYLNALSGRGVHVVTVNDYLAKRDSEWMGKLYSFLGLSVGVIVHDLDDEQRVAAYAADVTYGTNNEFGFDYLRDNMKFDLRDCVQRGHNYAIVDEVDSILIDEARTPLIISGTSEESTDKYYKVNGIIPKLTKGQELPGPEPGIKIYTGDYTIDEKNHTVTVTEDGWEKVERLLGIGNIADPENWEIKHHVETGLKAHNLYKRDVEYVVKDGEVIIVDEFTGRLMPGRRWSDGLHQAVEAKEGVKIERENQTLATITFQNYFRMFKKLAGMTGTAETEAAEFDKIYRLEVVVIPTNRDLIRIENPDTVYRTEKEKYFAAADEVQRLHETGQPVLVGTVSIEKSERLSELLKKKGISHVVLNAKHHEKEAEIVAQAGRFGRVTIATNMAGRGTDILLGGNAEFIAKQESLKKGLAQPVQVTAGAVKARPDDPTTTYWYYQGAEYRVPTEQWQELVKRYKAETEEEHKAVIASGGLFILGTERHEARRIDNQLRGRAGRQGDPGRFAFLSFAGRRLDAHLREGVGGHAAATPGHGRGRADRVANDYASDSKRRRRRWKRQHFEARKHLLEYDDVMNKQREAVYGLRRQLLEGLDQKELIQQDYVRDILGGLLDKYAAENVHLEDWDIAGLKNEVFTRFGVDILAEGVQPDKLNRQELGDAIFAKLVERYDGKEQLIGPDAMRHHERIVMLSVLDQLWKDHLLGMDHLKEGIGLRGYGQKDPLVEYKRESFDMFEAMMERFEEETVRFLYAMQVVDAGEAERLRQQQAAAEAQFSASSRCARRQRRSFQKTPGTDFDRRYGRGLSPQEKTRAGSRRGWPGPGTLSRYSR